MKTSALLFIILAFSPVASAQNVIHRTVDPKIEEIRLYWKDGEGHIFGSIANLKSWLESQGQSLTFAMNGGMFQEDHSPLGLFIENGRTLAPINRRNGAGNFYMVPNGIFYLSEDRSATIVPTKAYRPKASILFATQSGPLLIIDGKINPLFQKSSKNLNVRNGVGILPDRRVVFAISKAPISFYDFAIHFQSLGCRNALYLDGSVSQAFIPEQNWTQLGGHFGVLIGVTKKSLP